MVLPERLLALTELTGESEAGLEDLFDEAFYLHLLAATGVVEELDPAELAGEGVGRPAGRAGHRRRRRPLPPGQYLLSQQQRLLPAIGREPLHRFARLFATLDEL